MKGRKRILLVALGGIALTGALTEAFRLMRQGLYFWTLIRLAGFLSLLTYALLMFRLGGYNNPPTGRKNEN